MRSSFHPMYLVQMLEHALHPLEGAQEAKALRSSSITFPVPLEAFFGGLSGAQVESTRSSWPSDSKLKASSFKVVSPHLLETKLCSMLNLLSRFCKAASLSICKEFPARSLSSAKNFNQEEQVLWFEEITHVLPLIVLKHYGYHDYFLTYIIIHNK